jgi:hypothetical protein
MLFKCIYYFLNYLLINVGLLFYVLLILIVKKFWRKALELCDKLICAYLNTQSH